VHFATGVIRGTVLPVMVHIVVVIQVKEE
jgi:hypothetical protein